VIGGPEQDERLCRMIADRLGAVVAAVDYRLAPEHPFPAALHDCYDALFWLASRPDVDRVAVGGASAGGALAAAVALLARERGEVHPMFQLLSYPMLDDRTALRDDLDARGVRLWNNDANRFAWRSYLGVEPGSADVSGLAAPARNDDLTGLPPAWIGVGQLDILHDEAVVYADRLAAAGVACELTVVPGAFHGFDSIRPNASITSRFRETQLRALAAALTSDDRPSA
jgi:acetyl esterase/lipase